MLRALQEPSGTSAFFTYSSVASAGVRPLISTIDWGARERIQHLGERGRAEVGVKPGRHPCALMAIPRIARSPWLTWRPSRLWIGPRSEPCIGAGEVNLSLRFPAKLTYVTLFEGCDA